MHKMIYPKPPYDMNKVLLRCKSEHQHLVTEKEEEVVFPVRIKTQRQEKQGNIVVCSLKNKGCVQHPQVQLDVYGDTLSPAEQKWLVDELKQQFKWETDELSSFYNAVKQSTSLNQLVQTQRGLPFILRSGVYEGFVQAIISQQVNVNFAKQLKSTLAEYFGEKIVHNDYSFCLLPTSAQLAQAKVDALHQLKFSRRKAEYIIEFARLIVEGKLDLNHMSELDDRVFIQEMTKIRGVGVWTVECVQLFSMGRKNVFPAGDLALQKAIQQLEGWSERPSPATCREWVKPYQEWASFIAVYLWGYYGLRSKAVDKS